MNRNEKVLFGITSVLTGLVAYNTIMKIGEFRNRKKNEKFLQMERDAYKRMTELFVAGDYEELIKFATEHRQFMNQIMGF